MEILAPLFLYSSSSFVLHDRTVDVDGKHYIYTPQMGSPDQLMRISWQAALIAAKSQMHICTHINL